MVDIEHKTLKLLQQNLSQVSIFIRQREDIKQIVVGDISYIENWNERLRLKLYKEIGRDIISSFDINDVYANLAVFKNLYKNETDVDLSLIYSVLGDFFNFFDGIYQAFLLNQIVFLLMNFSVEELSKSETVFQAYQTNSYFESVHFGLDFEQEKLYPIPDEEFSKFIYNAKMECKKTIKKLLLSPKYMERFKALNKTLENYIFSDGQNNSYANQLFITLNVVTNKGMIRKKIKIENVSENIEDNNSLTLF